VFRSIGAFLDQRGMKEVLLAEAPDGFIVQGLVTMNAQGGGAWSDSMGQISKETLTFLDDDIARFMDEAVARRGDGPVPETSPAHGYYEHAFRVLGRYMDTEKPKDVFFFEQEGAFVVRLLMTRQGATQHVLAEFTRDDIEQMVAYGPTYRRPSEPGDGEASESTDNPA